MYRLFWPDIEESIVALSVLVYNSFFLKIHHWEYGKKILISLSDHNLLLKRSIKALIILVIFVTLMMWNGMDEKGSG